MRDPIKTPNRPHAEASSAGARLFHGGCHCGNVRFEVSGLLEGILDCNCSICIKKGFLHWIVPPERFRLLSGDLKTYTFGTHTAKHSFCSHCGVHPFYTPRSHPDQVDVNVRCLDNIDLESLHITKYNGRDDWEAARAALNPLTSPPQRIRLSEKLAQIHDYWDPRIACELNGQHVRLAKFLGPFIWHSHSNQDELFLILEGQLQIELRTNILDLEKGDLVVIPRGTEHRPVAKDEVSVLLFEPASTINTGTVTEERTRLNPQKI